MISRFHRAGAAPLVMQPMLSTLKMFATPCRLLCDAYDLRSCGASSPKPFEVDGNPTDITSDLAAGKGKVGYSKTYADNWSQIFGKKSSTESDATLSQASNSVAASTRVTTPLVKKDS